MIEDAFEAFLHEPTRERYRRLRRMLLSDPSFIARTVDLAQYELLSNG